MKNSCTYLLTCCQGNLFRSFNNFFRAAPPSFRMGKRSTNTTKGGKFMNPTDQARKEARRKELKKNKKQRQVVRVATLKGKNPREIIEELEKIDDMEYNPVTPCALNAKVCQH